jgi:Tfp pilus assembly protein PilF
VELAALMNHMGSFFFSVDELDEAAKTWKQSLEITCQLDPTHPNVATVLCNIAKVYHRKSDPVRALNLYHKALQLQRSMEQKSPTRYDYTLISIAMIHQEQGDLIARDINQDFFNLDEVGFIDVVKKSESFQSHRVLPGSA